MLMAIDPFFGSVLSAATSGVGGLIGHESARKANENAHDAAENNRMMQMLMATTGLTFRARDAMHAYKETGIHPLAMLGVQGPTYSPASSAFTTTPLGDAVGKMGQDISRGIHASADLELRKEAMQVAHATSKMALERAGLENTILKQKIASDQARLSNVSAPVMPSPGRSSISGDAPALDTGAIIRDSLVTNEGPYKTPDIPEMRFVRTRTGGLQPVQSKEFQEASEDSFVQKLPFYLREYVKPFVFAGRPPNESPGEGKVWVWNPFEFAWFARSRGDWDVFSANPKAGRIPVNDRRYNFGGHR